MKNPSLRPEWATLQQLSKSIQPETINSLFDEDPARVGKFSVSCGGLYLDYSKNLVSDAVKAALVELAEACELSAHIEAMFNGQSINSSEDRAVLHTALRSLDGSSLQVDGTAIGAELLRERSLLEAFSARVRSGEYKGSSGKPICDVVNIGIGGSDLGPKFVCQALQEFAHPGIGFHFISNVDGACIRSLLQTLNPETTLFIIQSKTFTTQETLLNTQAAIRWYQDTLGLEAAQSSEHFVAVTASPQIATEFGIHASRLFKFWDWVGGRYSLWSSIGLPIALMVGYAHFMELLQGARDMDEHFRIAPFAQNMPVLLALLGIWYSNFLDAESHAVIPYCERMALLPSYLQQLDMESNGKSVTHQGEAVSYKTGPIIWGQTGTNGQHAFFQLLHQGTRLVPVDFIAAREDALSYPDQHRVLLGNMLAQSASLMQGQSAPGTPPHKVYPGNRPSNTLLMERLTPANLGALIALYEHKVFVQGTIWNINSFDQWGVELGKNMARELLGEGGPDGQQFDASTAHLFALLGPVTAPG